MQKVAEISIHAPLAGSDLMHAGYKELISYISIHAPLAGSDRGHSASEFIQLNFNPRSPCGERPA